MLGLCGTKLGAKVRSVNQLSKLIAMHTWKNVCRTNALKIEAC